MGGGRGAKGADMVDVFFLPAAALPMVVLGESIKSEAGLPETAGAAAAAALFGCRFSESVAAGDLRGGMLNVWAGVARWSMTGAARELRWWVARQVQARQKRPEERKTNFGERATSYSGRACRLVFLKF